MFEAQLGALRDIDFGIYPYTSSSSTIAAYAPIGAGIPGSRLDGTIGIMKAYSSCVGEGPFTAELFGQEAALQLEGLLRESLLREGPGAAGFGPEAEYAVRFLSLLVRKNLFRRCVDSIVRQIEKRLNEQKGILEVTVECAASPDSGFEEYLENEIRKKTGAPGIKLLTRRKPELLGGYRLRIGGFCVDASLRGQLANMAKELEHG
jgi:hypothetical protein